jgi:hypothetical protein
MSKIHAVTLIGSQYRIESWVKILSDGGVAVTAPDQLAGIGVALCLGTVMERPLAFGVWWVQMAPIEDCLTAAHLGIGRRSGEEVSAAFHGAIHGLRLFVKVGEVTSSPRETAGALRRLLASAQTAGTGGSFPWLAPAAFDRRDDLDGRAR